MEQTFKSFSDHRHFYKTRLRMFNVYRGAFKNTLFKDVKIFCREKSFKSFYVNYTQFLGFFKGKPFKTFFHKMKPLKA